MGGLRSAPEPIPGALARSGPFLSTFRRAPTAEAVAPGSGRASPQASEREVTTPAAAPPTGTSLSGLGG